MQLIATLSELPPSQLEVLRIILRDESLKSSTDIINEVENEAGYSQRAVRYALKSLLELGIIEKHPFLPDTRQSRYKLTLDLESLRSMIRTQLDSILR